MVNQRQQLQQSEWLDADHIPSYDALRASILQHTSSSIFVKIKLYIAHVLLYNLDHAEDIDRCVRVSSTIRIQPDMRVRVFCGGERLPDKGLQWAFSHTCGTLKFWSQLDNVISRYFNSTLELDSATRCNMLAESIERISPETDDKQQTVMFLVE